MNGNSLFLDTNIILYLLKGDKTLLDVIDQKIIYISFITELELLGFKNISPSEISILEDFISDCTIINLSDAVKRKTVQLKREHQLKLPDAIIIASSLVFDIPLITADKDFQKVKDLSLIQYEP